MSERKFNTVFRFNVTSLRPISLRNFALSVVIAFALSLVSVAGHGQSRKSQSDFIPIIIQLLLEENDELVLPEPDSDPCDLQTESCESGQVGNVLVFSVRKGDLIQSTAGVVTSAADNTRFQFSNNVDGSITVSVKQADDAEFEDVIDIEHGSELDLEAANLVSLIWFGLNQEDSLPALDSHWRRAIQLPSQAAEAGGNEAGCDDIQYVSCTQRGACCDVHDVCIDRRCSGASDSGNVLVCLERIKALKKCTKRKINEGDTAEQAASFCMQEVQTCSELCQQCHDNVTECFLPGDASLVRVRGKSSCCDAGNCGLAQQCIKNGRVITDASLCDNATSVFSVLTGIWRGTYSWDCGGTTTQGSTSIEFEIQENTTRTGVLVTARYLNSTTPNVVARYDCTDPNAIICFPDTREAAPIRFEIPSGSNHVNNRFQGVFVDVAAGIRMVGTTLNGDSGVPGSNGCSAPVGDAGSFSVTKQ